MVSEQESSIYNKSLDILSYREHSRKELKNKLIKKFDNAQLVEKTLTKLEDNNLINDIRFAEAYISMRKRKGFGPKKIFFELKEKGIPDSVARKIIEEEGGWAETASKTFVKKLKIVCFWTCICLDVQTSTVLLHTVPCGYISL